MKTRLPGQQRHHRCDEDKQVEDGVLQEALHGPVGVGGGVAGGAGGVVAERHGEEQAHAEGHAQPVHPGLRAGTHTWFGETHTRMYKTLHGQKGANTLPQQNSHHQNAG